MEPANNFEVIIIGGSYSGLSAAMALGRASRKVLMIDSGKPCNRQTPHSHNFLTQDGETPKAIADKAREQVLKYDTIKWLEGIATSGKQMASGFEITTAKNEVFYAKKLLFATGIKDLMPEIEGFAECWGISVIHCPYCHGYEVRNEKTGILGNGDYAFEFSKTIRHWTKDLTVFTNGKATMTAEQLEKIKKHGIEIVEKEIEGFEHENGKIQFIRFKDQSKMPIKAIYARVPFVQHCDIPGKLGCELTEQGYIKVDQFFKTTAVGIYASGDNVSPMRSVAMAVSGGTMAGVSINKELIEEEF
jgi:thioredoxin reductase